MQNMPAVVPDPVLSQLTDQCVRCGLCQPQCPTYRLDRHESESPRGRIAIARKLANGSLTPSATLLEHWDNCLGCLSCQSACPSKVEFEDILIRTRALVSPFRARQSWLRHLLSKPNTLRQLVYVAAKLKADRWMPRLANHLPMRSLARRLASEMPPLPSLHSRSQTIVRNGTRGSITLFQGCIASVFDRDTLNSGAQLLAALGYEVLTPKASTCCGALALHAGETDQAANVARATRAALEQTGSSTVLVSASGCLGSLRDHTMAESALKVGDIIDFIVHDAKFSALKFSPLSIRAALHLPCTQMNVSSGGGSIRKLLAQIPQLEILSLPEQPRCCGAAGTYFIDRPEQADRLRTEKLDQITLQAPDLLLTSNIGCRLFLGNGLRQRDSLVPVLHPLTLLAQQLEIS